MSDKIISYIMQEVRNAITKVPLLRKIYLQHVGYKWKMNPTLKYHVNLGWKFKLI